MFRGAGSGAPSEMEASVWWLVEFRIHGVCVIYGAGSGVQSKTGMGVKYQAESSQVCEQRRRVNGDRSRSRK